MSMKGFDLLGSLALKLSTTVLLSKLGPNSAETHQRHPLSVIS